MPTELLTHFFLLPQKMPLAISCSMSGWSVAEAHAVGCCATYRSRARIIAELPTVQPRASEASWLSCWSRMSASRVSVWERTTRNGFFSAGFARAIGRDHISCGGGIPDEEHCEKGDGR